MKRIGLGVTVVSIVVGFSGCSASSDDPSTESTVTLRDGIVEAMREGHAPTSVLVRLKGSAELAPNSELAALSKVDRIQSVRTRLRDYAKASQGPLLDWLAKEGASVTPFHIINAVLVEDASPALIRKLAKRSEIEALMVDKPVPLSRVPSDDEALTEAVLAVGANITATGAPRVWNELGIRGEGVVIAGQDTGVQWDHPALKSHYRGWNGTAADHKYSWHDAVHSGGGRCGANAAAPCDDNGHGTHTIGTVVGDDGGSNQIGMAPGAKWIACRNMDQGVGTTVTYIECSQWFLAPYPQGEGPEQGDPAMAPDVINNSWGCPFSEGCTTGTDLKEAVSKLTAAGIVFVASAGNAGSACRSIGDQPATFSDATLSVGAYNHRDGRIANFSSRGPSKLDKKIGPDVTAPGMTVRSSVPGGGYESAPYSGTSMAGPHVVGEIALLISANPSLRGNVAALTNAVTSTATRKTTTQTCDGVSGSAIPNNTWGYGIINAFKAVQSVR